MNITDILAGQVPSEAEYYAQDPFYSAGRNILGFQARPTSDAEAWLGPILQGLAGGGLMGYGRENAGQKAFQDAQSFLAPMLQKTNTDFIGPPTQADFLADPVLSGGLTQYLAEQAPEGFSPNKARTDILTSLLQGQQAQEVALEQSKQKTQLANELLKDGMMITQDGQIQKVPMLTETRIANKADEAGATERAKLQAKLDLQGTAPAEIPSAMIPKVAASNAVIEEAKTVSDRLATLDSWTGYKAAQAFGGLDKDGIALELKNLADRFARARTGAAMNKEETELYQKLVGGDLTVDPKQASKLLRKLADAEGRMLTSELNTVTTLQQQGPAGIIHGLSKPHPSQFKSLQEFQAAKQAWRQAGGG